MTKLIKNRDGNFTHVKNDIFDSGLSAKAMGLFTYMWHLPDNWQFYEDELVNHFKDGKASIRTGLKELEDYGFLERKQNHDESNGKFGKYDWQLNESPFCDYPKADKPKAENPPSENRTLQNTNTTKDVSNKLLSSSSSNRPNRDFNPYDEWAKLWGYPNAVNLDDINRWRKQMSDELICLAIKNAGRNNVKTYGAYRYIKKTIDEWQKLDIDTVVKAKQQITQHEHLNDRNIRNYPSKRPTINRKMPESMKERYDPDKDKLSPEKKEEVNKMLADFYKRGREGNNE